MNNEVNLILTKLKIVSEEKENGMYLCDKKHSKLLYDYITKLQQENGDLKDRLKVMEHFKNSLLEENEDYKSGCEKATELIEKSRVKATPFFKQFDGDLIMPKREVDKLLNILNGDEE